jgi:hypothetical protein
MLKGAADPAGPQNARELVEAERLHLRRVRSRTPNGGYMVERQRSRQGETKTDVEVLGEHALSLEKAGMLKHALWVWRDVLRRDGNYLPAWEASSRLLAALSRQDEDPS